MKNLLKSTTWLCLAIIAVISCNSDDGTEPNLSPLSTSTNNMVDFISGEVLGTTTVERYEDKIKFQVNTSNLIPGHVYHLIVATIDQPEYCETKPCTHEDWIGNVTATRPVFFVVKRWISNSETEISGNSIEENDINSFEIWLNSIINNDDFGGLQDASKAEIHIFIRSAGPVIGDGAQQLATIDGECTTNYNFGHPDPKTPMVEGECGWLQQSVHLSP